jgi:hypothetical protein
MPAAAALAFDLEHRGIVKNAVLNCLNTGIAAAAAIVSAGRL